MLKCSSHTYYKGANQVLDFNLMPRRSRCVNNEYLAQPNILTSYIEIRVLIILVPGHLRDAEGQT